MLRIFRSLAIQPGLVKWRPLSSPQLGKSLALDMAHVDATDLVGHVHGLRFSRVVASES